MDENLYAGLAGTSGNGTGWIDGRPTQPIAKTALDVVRCAIPVSCGFFAQGAAQGTRLQRFR